MIFRVTQSDSDWIMIASGIDWIRVDQNVLEWIMIDHDGSEWLGERGTL